MINSRLVAIHYRRASYHPENCMQDQCWNLYWIFLFYHTLC